MSSGSEASTSGSSGLHHIEDEIHPAPVVELDSDDSAPSGLEEESSSEEEELEGEMPEEEEFEDEMPEEEELDEDELVIPMGIPKLDLIADGGEGAIEEKEQSSSGEDDEEEYEKEESEKEPQN